MQMVNSLRDVVVLMVNHHHVILLQNVNNKY